MIGTFWNLCRACPSMPVDKLHSEYRSTYKWHEFKQQGDSGVVRQPAPAPPTSLPFNKGPMEPAMPRRKKYPGVAYKTNELFDPAPVDIRPTQPSERARRLQRDDVDRAGRRSKSEGPRQTRWTDTVEPKPSTALHEGSARKEEFGTEYRKQFAWPRDNAESTPRKSISMGALKKAANVEGSAEAEPLMTHTDTVDAAGERPSKKYIGDYLWNGQKPQVQRKSTFRSALSALISSGEDRSKDIRKRYKTEYKKKFRPFSQYVYEASKGTFVKCRKAKQDEEAAERMLGTSVEASAHDGTGGAGAEGEGALVAAGLQPLGRERGDSWYREVLDLRKQAGEYKYRGWGTELAPEHLTSLYNKQIELWYQVSRRSSLSALSLATHEHKALSRDEKDGKDSKGHSPKKFRSFRSAPQQGVHAKLQETRCSPHKSSPLKQRRKFQGQSFDESSHRDVGKTSEPRPEYRSPRRRPRSADPAPAQPKHKPIPNGDARPKPQGLPLSRASSNRVRSTSRGGRSPSAPSKNSIGAKRVGGVTTEVSGAKKGSGAATEASGAKRVSGATTEASGAKRVNGATKEASGAKRVSGATPEVNGAKKVNGATTEVDGPKLGVNGSTDAPSRRRSRSISKVGIKLDCEAPSHRSASVAKDHYLDDSPVVKSPPEPTRVKSPEQLNMRSPDPVNWTVPLDTGKTFTVTQNVKTEIAPIHHQQMSPIRKKSESPTCVSKRTDKTPTTPPSLTPIDETKALDMKNINGVNGINGVNSSQATPDTPTQDKDKEVVNNDKEVVKKSTEATQVAPGVVDTTVVNDNTSGGISAAEVLEKARSKFDKFWGKKEEDNV